MHKYFGFGLFIASEIEFPELLPSDFTDADITISLGKTPETLLGDVQVKRTFSSINKYEYLANIRNICNYYVCYGNKIIVEPVPGVDQQSIRLFLLGTVMAAILYQREEIPLHASAIVKNGKLILFAGNSGAGKSTLLARLMTKGYDVFTDDVCVLKQDVQGGSSISGTASYPMMKLWDDAIAQLDTDQYNMDFKVRPELPKYGQFFYDSFNLEPLPIDKIFILSPKNDVDDITVTPLFDSRAFRQLEKQVYKYNIISHTELRTLYFSVLSQLTNQAQVFEVTRPLGGTGVELLSDALENFF